MAAFTVEPGGDVAAPQRPLHVAVCGDSTCSVAETAHALADGRPYGYCDLNAPAGFDLRIAHLPDGTKLILTDSPDRQRFRALELAAWRGADAVVIVVSELDGLTRPESSVCAFLDNLTAVRGDGPAAPPVMLLPTAGAATSDGAPRFSEAAKRRAAAFAAEHSKRVQFSDAAADGRPEALLEAFEALAERARRAQRHGGTAGIHWERQRKQLCGMHALNGLLGRPHFQQQSLDDLARRVAAEPGMGSVSEHKSALGLGSYSVAVLLEALREPGVDCVAEIFSRRISPEELALADDGLLGFIVNRSVRSLFTLWVARPHWLALRKLRDSSPPAPQWVNVDSRLAHGPTPLAAAELPAFMDDVLEGGGTVLRVSERRSD